MSSRLFQEIRERRGLAYSVYSYHSAYRDGGLFGIYAGTSLEHLGRVLELIHFEIERLARKGLTRTELKETKEHLKGSMLIALESTTNRMNRLATGFLYQLPPLLPEEAMKPYLETTQEEVAACAREMLDEKRMAITLIAPRKEVALILEHCPFSGREVVFEKPRPKS